MSMVDITAVAWPASRLSEAMEALARRAGLLPARLASPLLPNADVTGADSDSVAAWVEHVAQHLGIEAEPVDLTYADAAAFLRHAEPVLIPLPTDGGATVYLAAWQSGWRGLAVIAPEASTRWLKVETVREVLTWPLEAPLTEAVDRLLAETGIPASQAPRVRAALLAEQLGAAHLRGGWMLRRAPSASVWQHVRDYGIPGPVAAAAVIALLQQVLLIVTWAILGQTILTGRWEWVWLWAWALAVFSAIPLQAMLGLSESLVATRLGALFKERLLHGILQLQPEAMRHEGVGQFLGRVLDADAVEVLSISTAFAMLLAVMQLGVAVPLFVVAGGSWPHGLAVAVAVLALLLGAWADWRVRRPWFTAYREMTNDVAERMIGHRTRLAQEDRTHWHVEEDQGLERHEYLSQQLDRAQVWVAAIPRAWMVASVSLIAYRWLGQSASPVQVAILIGASLLVSRAFDTLVAGYQSLLELLNAWRQVGPLFQAAAQADLPPSVAPMVRPAANGAPERPVLQARDIAFRYRSHGPLVLEGADLAIRPNDRLLLEGPSGGGKSTLASLLAGLRAPDAGLLLLHGYDRLSLGPKGWRRGVVMAPQFHENHVFTGTFAFNLLLGRRWPPTQADMEEALAVCQELGLGDLHDRMPSGLQQIVGESGWQLSHGERSRLYIARALLQNPDVMILDESFAALDPENLALALRCVLQRAPALVVIAHP